MAEQNDILTLCVPGRPSDAEAARLVRSALGDREGAVEVEILPGRRDTLLLVHPAAGLYIDRRAAGFLMDRLLTDML